MSLSPAMGQVAVSCWGDLMPSWLDAVAAVQLALPRLLLSVLRCSLGAVVREQPVPQHGHRSIPLRGAFPPKCQDFSAPGCSFRWLCRAWLSSEHPGRSR